MNFYQKIYEHILAGTVKTKLCANNKLDTRREKGKNESQKCTFIFDIVLVIYVHCAIVHSMCIVYHCTIYKIGQESLCWGSRGYMSEYGCHL